MKNKNARTAKNEKKSLTEMQRLGLAAENLAACYLKNKGAQVLARRWRSSAGELDLVILYEEIKTIVFVEVKALRSETHHYAQENVTRAKQSKIAKSANLWRQSYAKDCYTYRFDVISLLLERGKPPRLRHFQDAFSSMYFIY